MIMNGVVRMSLRSWDRDELLEMSREERLEHMSVLQDRDDVMRESDRLEQLLRDEDELLQRWEWEREELERVGEL